MTIAVTGDRKRFRHLARDIEADGKIAERFHLQIDRIANDERAGADDRRRLAAEGQLAIAAGDDALAGTVAQRDMRGTDGELLIAVKIGEADAQPLAAEGRADNEAEGLVLERALIDRDQTGDPGAHPFLNRHVAPPLCWLRSLGSAIALVETRRRGLTSA